MRKRIIHLILVLVLAVLPVWLAVSCQKEAEDTQLVVGMELAYPPFEMTDAANNPTGISVDFAKALGEELGRTVVIENMAWSGLIPALETGKIDLIISSMTIRPYSSASA